MRMVLYHYFIFFFFNDTATTEIYTLSLHDALPISRRVTHRPMRMGEPVLARARLSIALALAATLAAHAQTPRAWRSEEHTSELQSRLHLVCRLLLEKKKKNT